MKITIGLIGDYDPAVTAHVAIPKALQRSADRLSSSLTIEWLATPAVSTRHSNFHAFDAFWCVPASPYADTDGALAAIRFAREQGKPFLGTCGGFQHALLEYAQTVLGMADAAHAETDPDAVTLLVSRLSCSLVEKSGIVRFPAGSAMAAIHQSSEANETYHCNYGLNPAYEAKLFAEGQLSVAARDEAGEIRALQWPTHPFFFATLYQPERSALRGEHHPLIDAFVAAAAH